MTKKTTLTKLPAGLLAEVGAAVVSTSFTSAAADWLKSLEADRAKTTVARYEQAVKSFSTWFEGHEKRLPTLEDLTPISLVGYRNHIAKELSVSGVNTNIAALRVFCTWLLSAGHLQENPASRLKLVKRQAPAAPKGLTTNQVNALLREASRSDIGRYHRRDFAIIMLLVQSGLRIGECRALNFGDIELGEKSGWLTVRAGKGNKTRRLPLNASARQAIADYACKRLDTLASLKAVAAAWPTAGSPLANEPLWISERFSPEDYKHQRITLSGIERIVNRVLEVCILKKQLPSGTTAHTLRHTFAQRYLASNQNDLPGLAELLGHSNLNTTAIYTRLSETEISRRVENLDLNAFA